MAMKRLDLVGKRFGKLEVIKYAGKSKWDCTRWLVKCDCGKKYEIQGNSLVRKMGTKSCGCSTNRSRGVKHYRWKGGRSDNGNGYISVLKPDHPNAWKNGYVGEHIIVMSEHLGRPLRKGETVHHKNGVKNDNKIKNLELWKKAHVPGQRLSDQINWAIELLKEYAPEFINKGALVKNGN